MKIINYIPFFLLIISCQTPDELVNSELEPVDSIVHDWFIQPWKEYKKLEFGYSGDSSLLPFPPGYIIKLDSNYKAPVMEDFISYETRNEDYQSLHEFGLANWVDLPSLSSMDDVKFNRSFFEEYPDFTSSLDSILFENENMAIIYLKMSPKVSDENNISWGGGVHPGIEYIVRFNKSGSKYSYSNNTGLIKYAMKYGSDPYIMKVHHNRNRPYVEVLTDAGGVGIGREGVTIYDLNDLSAIIYTNIFLSLEVKIFWFPRERDDAYWICNHLNIDTSEVKSEVHLESWLENTYEFNDWLDSLIVTRNVELRLVTWDDEEYTDVTLYRDTFEGLSFSNYYSLRKN